MKIYSTREAGNIFGVTPQTIISWLRKNNISCAKTSHHEHILTDETIEELRSAIFKRYRLNGAINLEEKLVAITPTTAILPGFEVDDDIWKELAAEEAANN